MDNITIAISDTLIKFELTAGAIDLFSSQMISFLQRPWQ